MKVVIQRVSHATVTVDNAQKSRIENGMLILLGVADTDATEDADWLVKKVASLRIFDDANGVMNLSVKEVGGEVMVVSQFTLLASTKKGNRPSYIHAASPDKSVPLYEYFCSRLSDEMGEKVKQGVFGANMKVELLNDGPVTICMDTKHKE